MYDILIRGGLLIDGTGAPGRRADLAVSQGRIAEIGDLSHENARRILNADGLAVAPGFIDSHAHSDTSFLIDSSGASKLYQGITTEISGQCGTSPFPALAGHCEAEDSTHWHCESFEAFLRRFQLEGRSMAVNQAMLVGHGSLRAGVIGDQDRAPSPRELEDMKALLRRDLQHGAWGLSLGLEYAPGFFAQVDELAALAGEVARYDAVVPCHMRSEGLKIDEAMEELFDIGRASGARVHISHLKIDAWQVHGRAREVWERLEAARRGGVRVTADMYPYTASCTQLTIRCPKWSQDGGNEAVVRFLEGPRRAEVVEGIRKHYFNAARAQTCLFNDDAGRWPEIVGKTLRFVAETYLHTEDYAEAAAEVLLRTRGEANCIFFVMDEGDMRYFLSRDIGIGSDGVALPGPGSKLPYAPHPRFYGTMAEFFRLAREEGFCSIEEAVRRVTSKAADSIGLTDRGRLANGLAADVTVFDPVAFRPRATYLEPVRLCEGVRYVLVNGTLALSDGVQTQARAGRFLKKPPRRS